MSTDSPTSLAERLAEIVFANPHLSEPASAPDEPAAPGSVDPDEKSAADADPASIDDAKIVAALEAFRQQRRVEAEQHAARLAELAPRRKSYFDALERYRTEVLAQADPLRTLLGLLNAGLMQMAVYSEEIATQAMAELQAPPADSEFTDPGNYLSSPRERLAAAGPLVKQHLQLLKQIGAFSKFDAPPTRQDDRPRASSALPKAFSDPADRFEAARRANILMTPAELGAALRGGHAERLQARQEEKRRRRNNRHRAR